MAANSAPRQVYRQAGVLITAAVVGVALLGLLLLALVAGSVGWALVMLGGIALCIGLFVRPHVILDQSGVTIANPVRTAHITWPAIDLVEARWNLTVAASNGHDYRSWAISAQRGTSRGSGRSLSGLSPGPNLSRFEKQAPDTTADHLIRARPGSAAHVADKVLAGKDEYGRAVERGAVQALEPDARVTVDPLGLLLVIGGLVLVVAGALLR